VAGPYECGSSGNGTDLANSIFCSAPCLCASVWISKESTVKSARFRASAAVYLMSSLVWGVRLRRFVRTFWDVGPVFKRRTVQDRKTA